MGKHTAGTGEWVRDDTETGYKIHYTWTNLDTNDVREEWEEYNLQNHLIHYKNSDGLEDWYDYDDNENVIHYKNHKEYEWWKDYDSKNNLTFYEDTYGCGEWNIYDSDGNQIYHKEINCGHINEYWIEYDADGNETRYRTSNGVDNRSEYDPIGTLIYSSKWKIPGTECEQINGKMVHYKDDRGFEWWKTYDENGTLVKYIHKHTK